MHIKKLWQSKSIQNVFQNRGKSYQLNDSAEYFFDNIDRLTESGYVPKLEDILRVRVKSTGIQECKFSIGGLDFLLTDVGGQRSERRKWIHCFEQVNAVIFCVAMSEYDLFLREDDSQNRMLESITLLSEIVNSSWFRHSSFILFMNKMDLFKIKIAKIDLQVCFPEYMGGCSEQSAADFIKKTFIGSLSIPLSCSHSRNSCNFN